MSNYKKPEIIEGNDFSEGIYAASGSTGEPPLGGTNGSITWTRESFSPEHDGRPHWVAYYSFTMPADYYGRDLQFDISCQGPLRHAGIKHQNENANTGWAGGKVHGEFSLSASNTHKIYVCCEPEDYPQAYNGLTISIYPK